jgi:intracellular septation protein
MITLTPQQKTYLRLAIDYSGAAAFLAGYLVTRNVQTATWWLVGMSAVAIVANFALERKLAPLPLIYGGASLVFGTLTLVLHDKSFIKMKPTFLDIAFGSALLIGLAVGKSPIKLILGDSLKLSEPGWQRLTLRYGMFFLLLAALNEVVWRTQSDATWALFRFPGALIISLLFSFTQIPMMFKEAKALEAAAAAIDSQQ